MQTIKCFVLKEKLVHDVIMSEAETKPIMPPEERREIERGWISHGVPFLAWLFLMHMLGDPTGWKYAVRAALCLGLFFYLKPWKTYDRFELKHAPLAIVSGLFVYGVWVFFETVLGTSTGIVQQFYLKYAVLPWGELPEIPTETSAYDPSLCGWPLSLVRLGGSAFVIAMIEEFAWRGLLYRWATGAKNFLKCELSRFDWTALLLVNVVFGVEHHRWLAGIIAGIVYTLVMIRTRNIWAAVLAHVITNFVLGVHVLMTGSYQFW